MRLRGVDFGHVWGAAGVQGFFGEGYWFHHLPFGPDFSGVTFVSKTATLAERTGNMSLTSGFTPWSLFPDCIRVRPIRGVMLNAVGLSNPGITPLLLARNWQQRTMPFFVSLMAVSESRKSRLRELAQAIEVIGKHQSVFAAPFGLQINYSCPTSGTDPKEFLDELDDSLTIAGQLGVPVVPKFSIASAPIDAVLALDKHHDCDAICVSNSIPFGWSGVDWQKVWGSDVSPLERYGGGGLSGRALRPLVCDWIARLRHAGFRKPINGGGGIMEPADVRHYWNAGASSIFIGSVAALRPWRVRSIILEALSLEWE